MTSLGASTRSSICTSPRPTAMLVGRERRVECGCVTKTFEQGSEEIGELAAFGGCEASEAVGLGLEKDGECVFGQFGSGVGEADENAAPVVRVGGAPTDCAGWSTATCNHCTTQLLPPGNACLMQESRRRSSHVRPLRHRRRSVAPLRQRARHLLANHVTDGLGVKVPMRVQLPRIVPSSTGHGAQSQRKNQTASEPARIAYAAMTTRFEAWRPPPTQLSESACTAAPAGV